MTIKMVADYGDWDSPVSVESIVYGTRTPGAVRACTKTGSIYFIESAGGRSTLIQVDTDDNAKDILPEPYSVGNSVYEYGAQGFNLLPDGRLIFSSKGNTVGILDPHKGEVKVLPQDPIMRYSSFFAVPASSWVLAIEEDHTDSTPTGVRNYIVAINTDTEEIKRVITGADFYFNPAVSPDGKKISWLQWMHPQMMFESAQIHVADWSADGSVSNTRCISGKHDESVAEPRWGPDGSFFFAQEVNGYRQLFRIAPGQTEPVQIKTKGLEDSDLAQIGLGEGITTYATLSNRHLIATAQRHGQPTLVSVDLETGEWKDVGKGLNFNHIASSSVAASGSTTVAIVAGTATSEQSVYRINIETPEDSKILRSPTDSPLDPSWISAAEHITIDSKRGPARKNHGFYFAPKSAKFTAPEGTLPPLIIDGHGGPTGQHNAALSLNTQYWTSRGYAYLKLNYTGSTGYGGEYRRRLLGNWGHHDADDAADFADHLVEAGRARAGAVGITGISAGGYLTLQCVTRHPDTFAGGVCISGISELVEFDQLTHKLESDYATHLLISKGTPEAQTLAIFQDRSPINHVDKIKAPVLLVHADKDMVVPISQAEKIYDAVKARGGDIHMVVAKDDGHSVGSPAGTKLWIEEEEKWWRKTLLKRSC